MTCGGQPATIVGTQGRDVLRGTSGNDVIAALGGDDVVLGLGGDDTICGGPGRDVVVGGGGHDACAGEVVRCESRVVGSPDFPFLIDPSAGPLVNGKTDNLVSVEFDGGGDVTTPLWVTIAFTSGATFTQTLPIMTGDVRHGRRDWASPSRAPSRASTSAPLLMIPATSCTTSP